MTGSWRCQGFMWSSCGGQLDAEGLKGRAEYSRCIDHLSRTCLLREAIKLPMMTNKLFPMIQLYCECSFYCCGCGASAADTMPNPFLLQ